jgi:hypothetical protein
VGVEVVTSVVMKSSNFLDITPCSPVKVNKHFGGICRFYLQALLATCFHIGLLLGSFFEPEDGDDMLAFNGLYGVISKEIELFRVKLKLRAAP